MQENAVRWLETPLGSLPIDLAFSSGTAPVPPDRNNVGDGNQLNTCADQVYDGHRQARETL